ncbi:hypothetical protein GF342_00685 [Candidatus Woesearchaeota archaeon]|nr:hypothetical protein [Candidatus Woesearchaeota archaeon]
MGRRKHKRKGNRREKNTPVQEFSNVKPPLEELLIPIPLNDFFVDRVLETQHIQDRARMVHRRAERSVRRGDFETARSLFTRIIESKSRRLDNARFQATYWRNAIRLMEKSDPTIADFFLAAGCPLDSAVGYRNYANAIVNANLLEKASMQMVFLALQDKLIFAHRYDLAARCLDLADMFSYDDASKQDVAMRSGTVLLRSGRVADARRKFCAAVDFASEESFSQSIIGWYHDGLLRGSYDAENITFAGAKVQAAVQDIIIAFALDHDDKRISLAQEAAATIMQAQGVLFERGKQTIDALVCLCRDYDAAAELNKGRNTHRVVQAGPYVYKVSKSKTVVNESFFHRYFLAVRDGIIQLQGVGRTGEGTFVEGETVVHSSSFGSLFALPSHLWMLNGHQSRCVMNSPKIEAVAAYDVIGGMTLHQYFENVEDPVPIYQEVVRQIACFHGFGPQHLLEQVPFIHADDARSYRRHVSTLMRRSGFFSAAQQELVRRGYDVIASALGNRAITTYVKDANHFNWMVVEDTFPHIIPIDFESAKLAGPGYDLVKLLEHRQHLSREQREGLMGEYIRDFNAICDDFTVAVPSAYARQKIEDSDRFLVTYENYVVDHVVKCVNNPNYILPEFDGLKRGWLRRGVDAVDWLIQNHQYDETEVKRLRAMQEVFANTVGAVL